MKLKEYFESLLGVSEARKLQEAIKSGKTIIITGEMGPTGKTTLKKVLLRNGCRAIEGWQTYEVRLDRELETLDFDFLDKIQ